MSYVPELKKLYLESVVPELRKKLECENIHQVPSIEKIVVNTGLDSSLDKGAIEDTVKDITAITGQKPVITRARKSVSNFKLREGMPNGVKVTLRGANMYEFLLRLIVVALPGIRDFRGVSTKLDGSGNYTLGIEDHTIFPEISMDGAKRHIGMDITIVTTATTDDDGRELLKLMGMPFRKSSSQTQQPTAA